MRVKNARASRALRQALDPAQYWLTSIARLCFATSAKSREKILATPTDQILDPLLFCVVIKVNFLHKQMLSKTSDCKHYILSD